jgi:hypothetical protein
MKRPQKILRGRRCFLALVAGCRNREGVKERFEQNFLVLD